MLVCLLFGCASVFAADTPTDPEPSAAQSMEAGRSAIEAINWSATITEFKAAEKEEPRNADAHNLLAYSFRKQAKPDLSKAFEHYRTALKFNPDDKGAHEYSGEAYLMDKKPAEAEKYLADLERICGNKTCEEYVDLARAIAQYKLQQ